MNTVKLRMQYLNKFSETGDLRTATAGDLDNFIADHPAWKPETVNAVVSTFKVFYGWALKAGKVDQDPTLFLQRVYVPRVVKVLANDAAIRNALDPEAISDNAIILLGREAGLRRSEIATLRTEHRDGAWLNVTGKGNRTRRLHIGGQLLQALEMLETLNGTGYYFPGNRDGHMPEEVIYRKVKRLVGTPPHSLRRRAITSVFQNSGNNIRLAQEFAGHSSPTITAIYIDVNDEDMKAAGGFAQLAA